MSSLLERYKDWVRRNSNTLSVFETGVSSITWLLPDRFSESEVALEAVHTAINLVSAFHDSIINEPLGPGAPPGGAQLVFALGALQQVQVLVELAAIWRERLGRGNRYDALIGMEAAKALLRLAILVKSHSRVLPNGGHTAFDHWASAGAGRPAKGRAHEVFDAFARFRQRHCLPPERAPRAAPCAGEAGAALQDEPPLWWEEPEPACEDGQRDDGPLGELRSLEAWAAAKQAAAQRLVAAGELAQVLRPLFYVAALRRWGRASWKPWVLSLVVELSSWRLTAAGARASRRAAARAAGDPAVRGTSLALLYSLQAVIWTKDESDELLRRKLALGYYLLRDPFFAARTLPALRRWEALAARLPLAGWAAARLVEIVVGAQQLYSYTSAS